MALSTTAAQLIQEQVLARRGLRPQPRPRLTRRLSVTVSGVGTAGCEEDRRRGGITLWKITLQPLVPGIIPVQVWVIDRCSGERRLGASLNIQSPRTIEIPSVEFPLFGPTELESPQVISFAPNRRLPIIEFPPTRQLPIRQLPLR